MRHVQQDVVLGSMDRKQYELHTGQDKLYKQQPCLVVQLLPPYSSVTYKNKKMQRNTSSFVILLQVIN
jgi:hypothetical protein